MLLRTAALAAVVSVVAACSGPAPACEIAGSDAMGVEVVMVYPTRDGQLRDVVDGTPIPLVFPPQGGMIALIGVRVRGVTGCSVNVLAALRDPCNGRIVGLELRPTTLHDRGDGWAVPVDPGEISNFANVAVCPVEAASHDIDGHPYQAEVRVTTQAGTVLAELSAMITPTCDGDAACRCICDLDGVDCATDPDASAACAPDAAGADAAIDAL